MRQREIVQGRDPGAEAVDLLGKDEAHPQVTDRPVHIPGTRGQQPEQVVRLRLCMSIARAFRE